MKKWQKATATNAVSHCYFSPVLLCTVAAILAVSNLHFDSFMVAYYLW